MTDKIVSVGVNSSCQSSNELLFPVVLINDRPISERTAISPFSTVSPNITTSLLTTYVSITANDGRTLLGNTPVVMLLAFVQSTLGTLPNPTSLFVT